MKLQFGILSTVISSSHCY